MKRPDEVMTDRWQVISADDVKSLDQMRYAVWRMSQWRGNSPPLNDCFLVSVSHDTLGDFVLGRLGYLSQDQFNRILDGLSEEEGAAIDTLLAALDRETTRVLQERGR